MSKTTTLNDIQAMDYRGLQNYLKGMGSSAKGSYDELYQRSLEVYHEQQKKLVEKNDEEQQEEIQEEQQEEHQEEEEEVEEEEVEDIKNQLWSKLSEVMPYVERIHVNITNDETDPMKAIPFVQISLDEDAVIEVDEEKIGLRRKQYNVNLKLLPLDCVFLKEHVIDMNFSSFNTWGEKTLTLTIKP